MPFALGPIAQIARTVADIALAVKELTARGVVFDDKSHLIARMDDHDLWMTFSKDPDGHLLSLTQEAPKGYQPPASGEGYH